MKQQYNNHVLIVDDKPENLMVLEVLLEDMNCNVVKAHSGNEALGLLFEYEFALVLLDVQMPEMDGFETAELMRGSERTRYIPIIFVTAISKEKISIFKGYEVGAVDYLFKPIEPMILKSKVKVFIELNNQKRLLEQQSELLELKVKELVELKNDNFRLHNLSFSDGLTGIANRRSFDEYMDKAWKNSIRSNTPISLIMIDIDFFKMYNDNYGHLQGDDCLIKVAHALSLSIRRPMDFVARYGGEEFIFILPDTDSFGALKLAEDIKRNIKDMEIPHEYSPVSPHVTISQGIATSYPDRGDQLEDFINLADKAMYNSKESGRNMITSLDDGE
nr:diguanylate cyclase [Tissierella sp.]